MKPSFLQISILHSQTGNWERIIRTFSTVQSANRFAKRMAKEDWAAEVKVHRGGVGGELVTHLRRAK